MSTFSTIATVIDENYRIQNALCAHAIDGKTEELTMSSFKVDNTHL